MIYLIAIVSVFFYSLLIYWLVRSAVDVSPVQLLLCVCAGMGSAVASLGLEYLWNLWLGDLINAHRSLIVLESFIGVGLVEEMTKWIWLVFLVARWRSFNRYSEGILFACGIAAGFNLIEGLLYIYSNVSPQNVLIRGVTAVPVHFLFAMIMGFFIARFKFESRQFLWVSIIIPVLLHGLYDFFILQQYAELLLGGAILVFAGCLSLSVWVCRTAMRVDRIRLADNSD